MVVPGYDPEDLDDALESHMHEGEIETLLTDAELASYRNGDASLLDLLTPSEIEELVETKDIPVDASEEPAE